jgi:hypothetical protein
MGKVGTPRSVMCPHGILGKRKCKDCNNAWARAYILKRNKGRRGPVIVPLEERFWLKVQKTETCWLWIGAHHPQGYGNITVSKGKTKPAHILSWEIHFGPIPEGMKVLHSCDNPPCVKPDHLFLGTQTQNIADMDAKGRRSRGKAHSDACNKAIREKMTS